MAVPTLTQLGTNLVRNFEAWGNNRMLELSTLGEGDNEESTKIAERISRFKEKTTRIVRCGS
jgi:hypothetical protein